jgi:hypothetical protein
VWDPPPCWHLFPCSPYPLLMLPDLNLKNSVKISSLHPKYFLFTTMHISVIYFNGPWVKTGVFLTPIPDAHSSSQPPCHPHSKNLNFTLITCISYYSQNHIIYLVFFIYIHPYSIFNDHIYPIICAAREI